MKKSRQFQPELLLPAGNPKAFHAAIKGGANAIYLGLQQLNARNRATNFTAWELAAAIKVAHEKEVKVYVTLNTVVRNTEIDLLIDTLFLLEQLQPDAVIVQDWGIVYLIQKFFPQLSIHASTQMANHNSAGTSFAKKAGIERVVLARELTKTELSEIARKSPVEIELFIHGALCYSFSGMCLFSSFLGGASANRGQCAQPCRRNYTQEKKEQYFFSLKDNQLIEHLSFLEELKINSLKIEGRLKSADYVFQVASAYRKAIDHPELRAEAQEELLHDLGREKTDYFYGKQVKDAVTQAANNGLYLGKVTSVGQGTVFFESSEMLKNDSKLRFRNSNNDQQIQLSVNRFTKSGNEYSFAVESKEIGPGDEVYLAGVPIQLPSKLNTDGIKIYNRCPEHKKQSIRRDLQMKQESNPQEYFLRIDQKDWLPMVPFDAFDGIIINLNKKEWDQLEEIFPLLKPYQSKIHFELAKFIAEGDLEFYQNKFELLAANGFRSFFVSHLSQLEIIPKGCRISSNENVYLFNDAAVKMMKKHGISNSILPLENDIVNLSRGSDRNGIVPMYFYPQLFYSRMPVLLEKEEIFEDRKGEKFRKFVRDGMTVVIPENPVAITQFKSKLDRYGFYRYLIDVSTIAPENGLAARLKKKMMYSDKLAKTHLFNFKRELK
ncbi:MAG: peptidase U32 family protein [Prolixibacteraceae bacterium]